MTKNMGTVDRIVRLVIVAAIALLYFTNVISGTLAIILGILGIIFLLTSIFGFCPLYAPFKFSTNKQA
jgi:predicted ABC-type exoprotein transport system permease subunit